MTPSFILCGYLLLAILVLASVTGFVLNLQYQGANATINNLNARVKAWWVMAAIMFAAFLLGRVTTVVVFAFSSFMALREFLTLSPSKDSDYWPLFIALFIVVPVHYWLLGIQWYGLFSIFIPVYMFALISAVSALSQDTDDFLVRNARVLFALMVCVYGVSHAPALLMLDIPGFTGHNVQLLFFFTFIVQVSDVLQYVFGKLLGKTKLAPRLSPAKTWEGFIGGGLTATLLGGAMSFITPFGFWPATLLALLIVVCGTLGGLVMSAVKRSLGAKDWGSAISGHGGYMDRLDSVSFAAPLFFHVVRYFWTP